MQFTWATSVILYLYCNRHCKGAELSHITLVKVRRKLCPSHRGSSCCSLIWLQHPSLPFVVSCGSLHHAERTSCLKISCLSSGSPHTEVATSTQLNMISPEGIACLCGTWMFYNCNLSVCFLGEYTGRGRRVFWYSKHKSNHPHRLEAASETLEIWKSTHAYAILAWIFVSIAPAQTRPEPFTWEAP